MNIYRKRKGPLKVTSVMTADASGPVSPIPASLWMAVFIFLFVSRAAEWIPGLFAFPISRVVFLVAAIVAYRSRETLSKVLIADMPIVRSAMWLMGLAVFSIVFSIYKSNTLKFIPGPITIILMLLLLQKVTPAFVDVRRIIVAMVWGGASLVIPTLLSYQGGRADIGSKNISLDTNDLAYVLVSVLPVALALRAQATGINKWLLTGVAITSVLTIFLTGSRGGIIALSVVSILITLKPISIQKNGQLKSVNVGNALTRLAQFAVLVGVVWTVLPGDIKARISAMDDLGGDYNASLTDNNSRLVIWTRDAKAVLKRPIGFGLGTAAAVDGMLGGLYKAAHNTVVQCFVELGFLGLFLLLRCYYLSLRHLGVIENAEKYAGPDSTGGGQMPLLARALRIAFVGNFVAAFFLSQAFAATLWALFGISAAMIGLTQAQNLSAKTKKILQ